MIDYGDGHMELTREEYDMVKAYHHHTTNPSGTGATLVQLIHAFAGTKARNLFGTDWYTRYQLIRAELRNSAKPLTATGPAALSNGGQP